MCIVIRDIDFFFSGKALLGPCFGSREGGQTKVSLACSLPEVGVSLFLRWSVSRGLTRGVTWFAYPLGSIVCREHAQYHAFAPDPLLLRHTPQNGSWVFLVSLNLLSRICPNCTAQLFLAPQFLYILLLEVYPGASTAAEHPRSQPVSLPLRDSKSLLFIGKGVRISSSETSSCWTGAADASPS